MAVLRIPADTGGGSSRKESWFSMIRIGAVNIDTSHPLGFGEVMEKENRARYVGVYNDSFRPDSEVEGFIKRFGLEKRCQSLEDLADMCDIGFIHGCNWDDHLRCAMPFIERGKPVFIDKPLVGNLADCRRVEQLVRDGAVILGASSARYAYEVQEFLALPAEERGEIVNVFGTAGVDEFNYGVHIAEAIGGIMGPGARSVRYMGRGSAGNAYAESYFVQYENGKSAIFNTFTGAWQPFVLTIMTDKATHHFRMDSSRLYEALVHEICGYMEGRPNRLAPPEVLLESVKVMLAASASRARDGESVALSALTDDMPAYNGRAFWESYSAAAGPLY